MRAYVNTPGAREPLALRDVADPDPQVGEALIAVKAFSLNRGELTLIETRPEGWRPGQDVAGIVLSAPDGAQVSPGDHVLCLLDGAGWAERVASPLSRLTKLPANVTFSQAAALPVAGLTALRIVRHGGSLLGRRVLVTGAAGGVGNLAVQLAALSGAQVTAVATEVGQLTNLGAAEVVPSVDAAKGSFHLILNSVGGDTLSGSLRRLDPNGALVLFGNSSREASHLRFEDFGSAQNARIQSFFSYSSGPEEAFAPDLTLLTRLVADGALKPLIGAERDWSELASMSADLKARRIVGKAILLVTNNMT